MGVVRESRNSGHPYIGHIARSSLQQHSFLVVRSKQTTHSIQLTAHIILTIRKQHIGTTHRLSDKMSKCNTILSRPGGNCPQPHNALICTVLSLHCEVCSNGNITPGLDSIVFHSCIVSLSLWVVLKFCFFFGLRVLYVRSAVYMYGSNYARENLVMSAVCSRF